MSKNNINASCICGSSTKTLDMDNINKINELLNILIAFEYHKDQEEKKNNVNLSGQSFTLFHLIQLKELIDKEYNLK